MASFDSVNYALRPNKVVERKIAFSGLMKISRIIDLSGHRYIGLGSLWFVDFLMAHKLLGIQSMTSIEANQIGFKRSEFNCPLACIDVLPGESTLNIPTLALGDRPSVVWFDYDTSIGGPVIKDLEMLATLCASNSVLIVTINAKKDELPDKDENDVPIDMETSLRRIAGDLVPTPLPSKKMAQKNYPKLLAEILTNQLQSAIVKSGRKDKFIKLFDIVYNDGTPMVTVGGIIASADKADEISQLTSSVGWEGIVADSIAVPPLTLKEKMALDSKLPSKIPLTVSDIHGLGFALKQEQIDTYHQHYLHYPIFGELF